MRTLVVVDGRIGLGHSLTHLRPRQPPRSPHDSSSMKIFASSILPSVWTTVPQRHDDERGFVSEVWREDALRAVGIDVHFVQENHALSRATGTVRGLHFQVGAAAQAKLVRCTTGAIFDVAVDIRQGSPTFGRHVATTLTAQSGTQLYIPVGFAHGYCTLEPDTEVTYKVTTYYDAAADPGLAWNDPALAIAWPIDPGQARLSERDRGLPNLADLPDHFPFGRHQG
jgi:dTDP-4-dehydrorhamnose 3,5-epimerase